LDPRRGNRDVHLTTQDPVWAVLVDFHY
jgi:hypothetical protein